MPKQSKGEHSPLQGESEGSVVSVVSLFLVAGGSYALSCVPLVMFVITQHKVGLDNDALDKAEVSKGAMFLYFGWACASLMLFPCADLCGRKWLYFWMLAAGLLATFLSTRAQSAVLYAVTAFFIGACVKASGQVGYLLLQESLPERLWTNAIVALNTCYSCIGVLVAVVGGTLARNLCWRTEVLLFNIPYVLIVLIGPLIVSESRQFVKAVPRAACDCDGWQLLQLWTNPELRFRTLMTLPCWVACNVGFSGLTYASGSLSRHFYTNLAMLSIADLLGYALAWPIIRSAGERRTQLAAFLLAAAMLLACAFIPPGRWRVACAVLGRISLDVAFTTIYLHLLQHFPPEVRGSATGTVNFSARLLGFLAPLFSTAAYYAISFLCLLAAAGTWALPEATAAASDPVVQDGYCGGAEIPSESMAAKI